MANIIKEATTMYPSAIKQRLTNPIASPMPVVAGHPPPLPSLARELRRVGVVPVGTLCDFQDVAVFSTLVREVLVMNEVRGKAGAEVMAVMLGLILGRYASQGGGGGGYSRGIRQKFPVRSVGEYGQTRESLSVKTEKHRSVPTHDENVDYEV